VLEANLMGTVASYHGNVPYSQAVNNEFPDPVFDSQVSIFNSLIQLLDSGIADLNSGGSRSLGEDIYFGGDADKWICGSQHAQGKVLYVLEELQQCLFCCTKRHLRSC
jgi:hypothetical protein